MKRKTNRWLPVLLLTLCLTGCQKNSEPSLENQPISNSEIIALTVWGAAEDEELLRQKDFCLGRTVDEGWLLRPDAVERIVAEFRRTQPFVGQLNRAVRYAYEEMM